MPSILPNIAKHLFVKVGNLLSFWQRKHLLVSGPTPTLFLHRILDRKHPSKIMVDVFVEILPAKNCIVKAVNFLTVGPFNGF
jgi:hypothetical protein